MRKIFCFLIGIVIGFPAFAKDTECNPISFRVTYSCGDGTLAKDKVLPENRVATLNHVRFQERFVHRHLGMFLAGLEFLLMGPRLLFIPILGDFCSSIIMHLI